MKYGGKYLAELDTVCRSFDFSGLEGKRVLITGGTGLIGSAIVDLLLYGDEVKDLGLEVVLAVRNTERARARFSRFCDRHSMRFAPYDALESVHIDLKADYIIHGAGNAHPAAYLKEPVETLMANVRGVDEMLRYAKDAGTERVLYISSSEVYGRINECRAYVEGDSGYVELLNPRSCYPSGKRAAETLCAAYRDEYGLDYVIARPGHIYGPTVTERDSRATAQFARDVLAGRDIVMKSDGAQLRSYCYSADCATAMLTMLRRGTAGEAYNISDRRCVVTIRQIAEAIAGEAGRRVIFAEATDAERRSYNMMAHSDLNGEKLEALGWRALFDLRSGVRNMLEIMREETEARQ